MSADLFEGFSRDLRDRGFWIKDGFIGKDLQSSLLDLAKSLYHQNSFIPAKVGKGTQKKRIKEIRGDFIHWIDDWSVSPLQRIHKLNEEMMGVAKKDLFLPLKRFESHFAVYPGGTRYLKHVDRHRMNPSRILSAVLYIGDWQSGGGGELVLFAEGEDGPSTVVEPVPCRMVVFDSNLVHEVKTTKKSRWSLTTWFRDDLAPALKL